MKTLPEVASTEFQRAAFADFTSKQLASTAPLLRRYVEERGGCTFDELLEIIDEPGNPVREVVYSVPKAEALRQFYRDRLRRLCYAAEIVYLDKDGNELLRTANLTSVVVEREEGQADGKVRIKLARKVVTVEMCMADPAMQRSWIEAAARDVESTIARHSKRKEVAEALAPLTAALEGLRARLRRDGRRRKGA